MMRFQLSKLWSDRPPRALFIVISIVATAAYWIWWRPRSESTHSHPPGEHGGIIVAVGPNHYHTEALFTNEGLFKLFTFDHDQTRVMTVPTQKITAYFRTAENTAAVPVALSPTPQQGDPPGQTSSFEGQMPLELLGSPLMVVIPSIQFGNDRYRLTFLTHDEHDAGMPRKVTDDAERQLYLTAGGKYTTADIKANGSITASQKYRGFISTHDLHPKAGERICPITSTKANPKCTWTVGGKQYWFCCPPCIDEFVKLAKEQPDQIKDPLAYVQK
jgi:YHS domain-containing protein